MDIEDLSKVQIILLVLLVSFVTSIATGIVTVSLLAQAPPAVTQTINHIIQRTVEAVAPTGTGTQTNTVKETTVVVKEDDLVTNSIATSFQNVGVIHDTAGTSSPIVALGTLIAGGLLITDNAVSDGEHFITFPATSTLYTVKSRFPDVGIAVMTPKFGNPAGGFHIADTASVRLGQSVISLASVTGSRVGIGSITARYTLAHLDSGDDSTAIRAIDTSISGKTMVGAPLINVTGDVIGVATALSQGPAGGVGTFVSLSDFAPLFLGVKGTSTPATAVTSAQ